MFPVPPESPFVRLDPFTFQIKGGDQLEELLRANEGWREYDIPTNPLDPGAK